MRSSLRPFSMIAVGGMLALTLAACGGSDTATATCETTKNL